MKKLTRNNEKKSFLLSGKGNTILAKKKHFIHIEKNLKAHKVDNMPLLITVNNTVDVMKSKFCIISSFIKPN